MLSYFELNLNLVSSSCECRAAKWRKSQMSVRRVTATSTLGLCQLIKRTMEGRTTLAPFPRKRSCSCKICHMKTSYAMIELHTLVCWWRTLLSGLWNCGKLRVESKSGEKDRKIHYTGYVSVLLSGIYVQILCEIMRGNATVFIRRDCFRLVAPLLGNAKCSKMSTVPGVAPYLCEGSPRTAWKFDTVPPILRQLIMK